MTLQGKGKKSSDHKDSAAAEIKEPIHTDPELKDSLKTQIPPDMVDPKAVTKIRRRLSVDGTDVNIDGIEDEIVHQEVDMKPPVEKETTDRFFKGSYFGKSQKGYAPYNPRKVNQDFMLMKEDFGTKSVILGTFDGHGEHGHCISEVGVKQDQQLEYSYVVRL